jgi:very-short-patch-repair endonuclease
VEIRHITEHYEKALLEVKKQLRKDLKSCDKVNWVEHIRNNKLEGLTEEKIRDLIEIYKDPSKFF